MARSIKSLQDAETKVRTYFRDEHLNEGFRPLASVWVQVVPSTGYVYAHYKFIDSKKKYKAPRCMTKWLDGKPRPFIEREFEQWKNRINQSTDHMSLMAFEPEFFIAHKAEYLRFCHTKAKKQSIQNYLSRLTRFVFPFFVGQLKLSDPKQWSPEYNRWEKFLEQHVSVPITRNHIRTALRRYLRFLEKKCGYPQLPKPTNENYQKQHREGKMLPGNMLPTYGELLIWFNTLPPGRHRWVIALCVAFGVRVSEALDATEFDLLGQGDVDDIKKSDDLVRSVYDKHKPLAFFHVTKAVKRQTTRKDITKVLGTEVDDDPKSGPYMSACFDKEWVVRIMQLIAHGEHEAKFQHTDGYKEVLEVIKVSQHPVFSQYGLHDFRRFNITRQVLHIHDFFAVARLHGQASVDTVKRYYQWGVEITRKSAQRKFQMIEHESI